MGQAGRKRIEEMFTLDQTVRNYRDFFLRIAGADKGALGGDAV
jgi:hypothetical protein